MKYLLMKYLASGGKWILKLLHIYVNSTIIKLNSWVTIFQMQEYQKLKYKFKEFLSSSAQLSRTTSRSS
jgi:hypothetical protein